MTWSEQPAYCGIMVELSFCNEMLALANPHGKVSSTQERVKFMPLKFLKRTFQRRLLFRPIWITKHHRFGVTVMSSAGDFKDVVIDLSC